MKATDKRDEMIYELGLATLREASTVIAASTGWAWPSEPLVNSPIEEMLLMALLHSEDGDAQFIRDSHVSLNKEQLATIANMGHHVDRNIGQSSNWLLFAQEKVGRYTLDFAIVHPFAGRIAIECDGHDFHERTKEQARHDRSRDRALQMLGWKVLRFTGSEIYADAHKCAREVFEAMDTMVATEEPRAYAEYLARSGQ